MVTEAELHARAVRTIDHVAHPGTKDGEEVLYVVQMVSCPTCGERIPIDDDTAAGTIVRHDGADHVLTKEFGAFALEAI